MSPPVCLLPRLRLLYLIDTDASKVQIGCAVFQTDGNKLLGFRESMSRGRVGATEPSALPDGVPVHGSYGSLDRSPASLYF